VLRTRIEPPGGPLRTEIWTRALVGDDADAALPDYLIAAIQNYALTPGTIARAAANAKLLAGDQPLDPGFVRAGVAAEVQEQFGELARRVTVTQTWNDLVLPGDTLDDIKAFVSRAAHTSIVYDQWGFRDKLQRGLGLAALFSGPPGTGKTMVAGLIANQLELDLYQVELSQVVSKWVGETEKQLGRIFDAASTGHALLLFDEADALFARRTEVKSSNDRYANLEVNYLLQRLEQFNGIAILTTNLEGSVDPAFKRRLAAEIPFYAPEVAERERLWRAMLPSQAPRDRIDFGALARGFDDLCGGNIRNAVLRAAFLAAADGVPISQPHLVRAARSEYRALGKIGS
jgi:SpoVK/Ycf46/Vps4 family AAA+-type ATPase